MSDTSLPAVPPSLAPLVWEHQRLLGVLQTEQTRLHSRIEEVAKTAREAEVLAAACEQRADAMDKTLDSLRALMAELKADLREQINEIKDGQRWITRVVIGAVVLSGLGLLFSGHVSKSAPLPPPAIKGP